MDTLSYCIGAALSAAFSVNALLQLRRSSELSHALTNVPTLDLAVDKIGNARDNLDGEFVVVTGRVSKASDPLVSYNGEECAVLSEKITTHQHYAYNRSLPSTTRTFRDVDWALSGEGGSVSVQRDSIREAYELLPKSVLQGLSHAGMAHEVPETSSSWLLSMLIYVITGSGPVRISREHFALPIGINASVAGALTFSPVDGQAVIRLHPALGLFLFRGPSLSMAAFMSQERYTKGAIATLSGAVAIGFLWSAARSRWPGLPSLRREMAALYERHLNWLRGAPTARAAGAGHALEHHIPDTVAGEGEETCVVCWENRPVIALIPCGHVCLCSGCSRNLLHGSGSAAIRDARCPTCRALVEGAMRVWGAGSQRTPTPMNNPGQLTPPASSNVA